MFLISRSRWRYGRAVICFSESSEYTPGIRQFQKKILLYKESLIKRMASTYRGHVPKEPPSVRWEIRHFIVKSTIYSSCPHKLILLKTFFGIVNFGLPKSECKFEWSLPINIKKNIILLLYPKGFRRHVP